MADAAQRLATREGTVYFADAPGETGGDEEYFKEAKLGRRLPDFIPPWACLVAIPVVAAAIVPIALSLENRDHGFYVVMSLLPITLTLAMFWYGTRTRDRNRLVFKEDGFRWRGTFFPFERIRKVRVDVREGEHLRNAIPQVSIFAISDGVCREVRVYSARQFWSADHLGVELSAMVSSLAENADTDPD